MSYQQPDTASFELLIDHAVGVGAALAAHEAFADLAPAWNDLRDQLLAGRQARDEARWALLGAQRKVDVRDALWDASVGDLSGRAFLAAGKRADAPPYSDLFGPLVANDLKALGPARAVAAAGVILAKGNELNHADLSAPLATLGTATTALQSADSERTTLREATLTLDIVRQRALSAVEQATAQCEIAILQRAPGRADLVRAFLAPVRPERQPKSAAAQQPAA